MDREKLNSNFDINAKCEDMIKTSEMIVDKYQCIIDRGYEPSIYVSLAYDVKNYLSKLLKENQKYKEVIDNLKDKLMEYFEVDRDCYFYVLTRDKSAFYYGTMSFDDFKEFNEEQVDDIIDFLKEVK